MQLTSEQGRIRRHQMLRTAFGPAISAALSDNEVIEVMANPDGRLWVDSLTRGRVELPSPITSSEAERIIRLVASHHATETNENAPIISAELPETGERFEGILPPIAFAPCFSIRKFSKRVFTLEEYVNSGIMTEFQKGVIQRAVENHSNIIVAGGTSSGKTTLVNAILYEVSNTGDRVVILEDTKELNCEAQDCVQLRTKTGVASLSDLVKSTLRLRPDRIVIGEVRGGEALDMLKAWNTGHPGGISTLHANSAYGALIRLEQLIQEVTPSVPKNLICEAVGYILFLKGRGGARKLEPIARVSNRLNRDGNYKITFIDEAN